MFKSSSYTLYLVLFAVIVFFQSISWYASGSGETGYFFTKIDKTYKKIDEEKKSITNSGFIKENGEKESSSSGKGNGNEISPDTKEVTKKETSSSTLSWLDTSIEDFYSKLVLETYKSQLKRNIKDLDVTLKKVYPEEPDRLEAYKKIKETYENVQDNIQEKNIQDGVIILNKKQIKIYEESITYLIWLLNTRIISLKK